MSKTKFKLSGSMTIVRVNGQASACYDYAADELSRLLGRMGVQCATAELPASARGSGGKCLYLTTGQTKLPAAKSSPAGVSSKKIFDGFVLTVRPESVAIDAASDKGILNGVYELAERMGYLFLLPGEQWEWPPTAQWRGVSLDCGTVRRTPRFAFRGMYGLSADDFTAEQWLTFFAKIKFNAIGCLAPEHHELAHKLGLRVETGGHGLARLLPRELFKTKPDLFRMFQPEDFKGRRQADSNLCAGNRQSKRIIQANFRKSLRGLKNVYAAHAWADDLPGGGWCMCSLCRGLTASDQYMLAMQHLSEVIRADRLAMRIPVIAYHDTILPPTTIAAPRESFLLYAPRERCYGHALDDPSCYRNRIYMKALNDWMKHFGRINDAHTFEYYNDQLLFRGMYPFIPGVILGDMAAYKGAGIESHMSIEVWGPHHAPDFSLLVFAQGHWDESLSPQRFAAELAKRIAPAGAAPWQTYLTSRQRIFEQAMQFCDYPFELYLDYRWIPENVLPFGRKMAEVYARTSDELNSAAGQLARSSAGATPRVRQLVGREVRRARFEAAELRVMAFQQDAMNRLGEYLSGGKKVDLKAGLASLARASKAMDAAKRLALRAGLSADAGYLRGFNTYLKGEFARKIKAYSK